MTTRHRLPAILAAITMTAALAACSTQSGADDSASAGDLSETTSARGSEPAAAADGAKSTATSAQDALSSGADESSPAADRAADRAVVSTGTISLRSKDVAQARRDVQRVVDAQRGAIAEENTETDDDGVTSYSRLVVRVPSARFDSAMTALEAAAELRSSNRSTEDVTTQVIDNAVRVRAQEASLKRVELLLSRAQSLKDIIWIESQLTTRQAELDSLKSQQSWLKDQTSLSTITIDIDTIPQKEIEKSERDEAGFLVGLKGGMNALVAAGSAVATIVGAVLPFAVILALLGFPIWLLTRRRRSAQPQA